MREYFGHHWAPGICLAWPSLLLPPYLATLMDDLAALEADLTTAPAPEI